MKKLVVALADNCDPRVRSFSADEFQTHGRFVSAARDPGVRGGAAGAGAAHVAGLTRTELAFFNAGTDEFAERGRARDGLGPTMTSGAAGGCPSAAGTRSDRAPVNPSRIRPKRRARPTPVRRSSRERAVARREL